MKKKGRAVKKKIGPVPQPERNRFSEGADWAAAAVLHGPVVLIGLAPLIYLKIGGEFDNNPKMAFLQWGIALLALVAAARFRQPLRWKRSPLDVPIVAFYAACLLSLVHALNPWQSVLLLLNWAGAIVFYFLLVQTAAERRVLPAVFFVTATAAGLVSLVGILQVLLPDLMLIKGIPQITPPASTFSNKNMAAQYCAICFPCIVGAVVLSRSLWKKYIGIFSIGFVCVYLLYTGTRSSWLSVLVSVVLFCVFTALSPDGLRLIKRSVRSRRFLMLAAALCCIVIAAGALSIKRDPRLFDQVRGRIVSMGNLQEGTARLRTIWQKNTLKMIQDNPLYGVGVGNFKIAYPLYNQAAEVDWSFSEGKQLSRVHMDHLQMLAELGVPGFCCYVWMLGSCMVLFFRLFRSSSGMRRFSAVCIFLTVISFMLIGSLSFPWERAMTTLYLFMSFALLSVLYHAGRDGSTVVTAGSPRTSTAVRFLLCCLLIGFFSLSVTFIGKVVLSDKYFIQGLTLQEKKRYDASTAALVKAKNYFPMWSYNAVSLLARNLTVQQKYTEAVEEYKYSLKVHPYNVNAMLNIGYCYLQMMELDKAEDYFKQYVSILPNASKGHNNLGIVYYHKKEIDKAIKAYERAAALDSTYAEPHYNLANIFKSRNNYARAISEYEKALEANPDLADARETLVNLYIDTGRLEQARSALQPFASRRETVSKAYLLDGRLRQAQGDHAGALKQYRTVIELDPENAAAYHNLGLAHYYLNHYEEAEQAFAEAIARAPGLVNSYLLLGQLKLRKQEDHSAVKLLSRAVELNPRLRDAQFHLGTACLRIGRLDRAVQAYLAALQLDPGFSLAHYNLATIYRHAGNYRQALHHFEKALESPSRRIDAKLAASFIEEMKRKIEEGG